MQSVNFKVPLIAYNLRPEEYRVQLADAFAQLKNVKNKTFEKLNDRISLKKANLQNLQLRIKHCQERIENVRGKPEATKILNKSKYPGSETFVFPETVFSLLDNMVDVKRKYHDIKTRFDQLEMKAKSVPMRKFFFAREILQFKADKVGIGSIPRDLISISSLLLFNTNVHVYKNYVIMNPLSDSLITSKEDTEQDEKTICAAPPSIAQGEDIWIPPRQNLFYIPGIGQVPTLDNLPEVLPNLGGVAINSGFTIESGPSLAPSVAIIDPNLIPELPELNDSKSPLDITIINDDFLSIGVSAGLTSPPPPPPPSQPPPPPPPPPSAPPPPPPSAPSTNTGSQNPDSDQGRNDLLKQIVATGGVFGAKLKSSKQKKQVSKKKKEENTNVPLSMLEDMQNRLKMRRIGMMGKGDENDDDGDDESSQQKSNIGIGIFREISQKIPHIPDKSSQNSDWEDE